MFIAFFGASGAGKSTIAKATVKKIRQETELTCATNSPFFNSGRPVWYKAWWSIKLWRYYNTRLYWNVFLRRRIIHTPTRFLRKNIFYWAYAPLIFKYQTEQLAPDSEVDVVLYDEDITLRHINQGNIGASQLTKEVITTYQDHILSHTDTVLQVVVETPVTTATKRFEKRDGLQTSASDHQRITADQTTIAKLVAYQVEQNIPEVQTISIDGAVDPATNAALIVDAIKENLQKVDTSKKTFALKGLTQPLPLA